ncbi:hypothetical protein EP56_05650 [Listeriaceae bacterium FSL A5-0209]|nr:hypothetical protein EP56_05650 [Listeriaceae bacterium FSL A5-0209]
MTEIEIGQTVRYTGTYYRHMTNGIFKVVDIKNVFDTVVISNEFVTCQAPISDVEIVGEERE